MDSGERGPDFRSNVFVSYSRQESPNVDQLCAALLACDHNAIIDRGAIAGSEPWKERIGALILEADAVIIVISKAWAASSVCIWELEEAIGLQKKIIPVAFEPVLDVDLPAELTRLSYIAMSRNSGDPASGFGVGLRQLITALQTDIAWLRQHTRLLQRASDWIASGRKSIHLLAGDDIHDALDWKQRGEQGQRAIHPLQIEYVNASQSFADALADEERKRLARLAQLRADKLKVRNFALVAVSLLALIAAWNWWTATERRLEAEQAKKIAEESLRLATNTASQLRLDLAQRFRETVGIPRDVVTDLFDRSGKLLLQLSVLTRGNAAVDRSRALALFDQAQSRLDDSDVAGASQVASEAFATLQALDFERPTPDSKHDLSLGWELTSRVSQEEGNFRQALNQGLMAVDLREQTVQTDPKNQGWVKNLAISHDDAGRLLIVLDRVDEAATHYKRALDLRLGAQKQAPADTTWPREVAFSYENLGIAALVKKDFAGARTNFREAIALRRSTTAADLRNREKLAELAGTLELVADAELRDHDATAALLNLREALNIRREIASSDKTDLELTTDLARCLTLVGRALVSRGETETAESNFREALALVRTRAQNAQAVETAKSGTFGNMTATSLGRLAWYAVLAREFSEAESASNTALAIEPEAKWIKINKGHALLFLGRVGEAKALYASFETKPRLSGDRIPRLITLAEDFAALQAAGLRHPQMQEIMAALPAQPSD